MVDTTFTEGDESIVRKYKDNGDGSYTEYVEAVIAGAVSIPVTSTISGQITVTTAGTAVQGSNVSLLNGIYIKALGGNTGKVYVGNDGAGDVTTSNGFELAAGDLILLQVTNLNQLWFDSATNGDKFCWLKA